MKKLAILSLTLLFVLTIGQISANPTKTEVYKGIKKEKVEETKVVRPPLKKLEGTTISQDSQTNFYMNIGNVENVAWKRGVYYDEATYTKDNQEMKAYFDINGSFVGTTTTKKFTDLFPSAQKSIKKLYEDCTIGQVTYFKANPDNRTDMTLYGVQFESQTVFLVELSKGDSKIVLMCDGQENVTLFK